MNDALNFNQLTEEEGSDYDEERKDRLLALEDTEYLIEEATAVQDPYVQALLESNATAK